MMLGMSSLLSKVIRGPAELHYNYKYKNTDSRHSWDSFMIHFKILFLFLPKMSFFLCWIFFGEKMGTNRVHTMY